MLRYIQLSIHRETPLVYTIFLINGIHGVTWPSLKAGSHCDISISISINISIRIVSANRRNINMYKHKHKKMENFPFCYAYAYVVMLRV